MINPKYIFIAVVFGFFLSIFAGIFAGVTFGIILLRAVIFSIIFGIVVYGALWVFQHFLSFGTDISESSAESSNIPRAGSKIDISIGDEPLPDDDNGPDFYVSNMGSSTTEQVVTESSDVIYPKESVLSFSSDTESVEKTATNDELSNEFKPVTLGTPVSSDGFVISKESMDVLPEINDISVDAIASNHGNVLENTDFALEGSSVELNPSSKRSSSGVMDTETIAKAIKTVLSKDS